VTNDLGVFVTFDELSIAGPSPIADLYSTASLRLIASPRLIERPCRFADPGPIVCPREIAFSRRP